jgi:hypothetical protein
MHNLKPYRQRVLGAYAMIEGALRTAGATLDRLETAIAEDRAARPETLAVEWERDDGPFATIPFTGMARERYLSSASGAEENRYLGPTEEWQLPVTGQHPVGSVSLPEAWWVPAYATEVIGLLDLHGIRYERTERARDLELEMIRLGNIEVGPVYDARVRMSADMDRERRRVTMPAGSVRVPYDQPRGLLAAALLEPEAVDSVFGWGFFPGLAEKGGSRERFLLAPSAERMLERDEDLRKAFEQRVATDPEFASDPKARLQWFAERSPHFMGDETIYPIGREIRLK